MPKVRADEREKLLERIRQLLALATSPNEFEAAAAAAKASELLMKYKVDMAEVEGYQEPTLDDVMQSDRIAFGSTSNVPVWKRTLAFHLASHNLCKMIWRSGSRYQHTPGSFTLVGREESILVTKYQYTYMTEALARALESAWVDYLRSNRSWDRDHKRAFATSFYNGAIITLGKRLLKLRQQENTDTQSKALIVVENKMVEEKYRQLFPHIRVVHATYRSTSVAGYAAGREAGKNLSIHTGVHGQSSMHSLPSAK